MQWKQRGCFTQHRPYTWCRWCFIWSIYKFYAERGRHVASNIYDINHLPTSYLPLMDCPQQSLSSVKGRGRETDRNWDSFSISYGSHLRQTAGTAACQTGKIIIISQKSSLWQSVLFPKLSTVDHRVRFWVITIHFNYLAVICGASYLTLTSKPVSCHKTCPYLTVS